MTAAGMLHSAFDTTAAGDETAVSPAPIPLRAMPPAPPMIRVRMDSLTRTHDDGDDGNGEGPEETVVDMQLIIDYTGALARRTASYIRDGLVERVNHPHRHPSKVTCLRCAVLSAAEHPTLAATLLEILNRSAAPADEDWNLEPDCTDTRTMSRLRRLAISSNTMHDLYGDHWGQVMLMCLRVERADLELLSFLTRKYQPSRVLVPHSRAALAAHHLAGIVCPRVGRDGNPVADTVRNAVAVRLAVTAGNVAEGAWPSWLDHLPAPAM